MLLDFAGAHDYYKMKIHGIVHVGAHLAEEAEIYSKLGIGTVYWIEGNPDNIRAIERKVARYQMNWVINALVTDEDFAPTVFHITNYDSMSSSVLEFGTHTKFSPDTVFVDHRTYDSRTLDSLAAEYSWYDVGVNCLNLDIQGAELKALHGATMLLDQIDYIYTEVNTDEVYVGCAKMHELDAFLTDFERVQTGMVRRQGWGDALYIRKH